jgi:hypothetical protein
LRRHRVISCHLGCGINVLGGFIQFIASNPYSCPTKHCIQIVALVFERVGVSRFSLGQGAERALNVHQLLEAGDRCKDNADTLIAGAELRFARDWRLFDRNGRSSLPFGELAVECALEIIEPHLQLVSH